VVAVKPFTPTLDREDLVVRVAEHIGASGGGISLTEAKVVVSGGRGVGSKEGFAIIEELAGLLGAAVGCSRAVTSAGWRPHTDQVGQTGTKIAPDIYIACGISGATQHLAGCKGAKKILAINSDGEAPIMLSADYAVIGDLKEIVPAISAEIRKHR
jgi:electron transfer flavoprotein alpha subunit